MDLPIVGIFPFRLALAVLLPLLAITLWLPNLF